MQARLVAQEKLAGLGELVSGVAHEISNPLNFVNNFSEGSLELYNELSEMLEHYRDRMSEEDSALFDDISQEMTNSLRRLLSNGGRALAIVERMRSFGVAGGDPAMTDLNSEVREAIQAGCNTFSAEWDDFSVQPNFELDKSVGEVLSVDHDFGEAMLHLVSNACYAMRQKGQEEGGDYRPGLSVSTPLVDNTIEVRVRDNKPGIADDVVTHIFNPFFSTRDGALGAGLGLPFAADVARRLGGDLSVDTVFGEYAEFTMTRPATSSDAADATAAVPEAERVGCNELTRRSRSTDRRSYTHHFAYRPPPPLHCLRNIRYPNTPMANAMAKPWITISVVRRRGVEAMPPKVLRMRGIASPIIGIGSSSKSRSVGRGRGSTVARGPVPLSKRRRGPPSVQPWPWESPLS